jgi:hypothetical protein
MQYHMSEDVLLSALAELRRHQLIATAANPATAYLYPPAFIYAVINSVYPLFHEGLTDQAASYSQAELLGMLQIRPYASSYGIDVNQVKSAVFFLTKRAKFNVELSELEEHIASNAPPAIGLRGADSVKSYSLICAFKISRYCFLTGLHSPVFWVQFTRSLSSKQEITAPWSLEHELRSSRDWWVDDRDDYR